MMLPGTTRPIVPPDFANPLPAGCMDISLSSYFLMVHKIENLSIHNVRDMNRHLKSSNVLFFWNSCNGQEVSQEAEFSLDAKPRNHFFPSRLVPRIPGKKRQLISVQKYFETKYNITLSYPNSPLFREPSGSLYPIECVYVRIRLF
ncbi:hypothetical protein GCK72_003286 [Caenorhabditis remanei]|uniref:Uncharacterized protein n=1 Tax=Caenorhabditis remanei TaxID=31234 RepID=A0A6A5HTC2_CAERE|nr:hypothetical protein GCK72_003286 [Caenorhabditis remanei]KAF1771460.1 hypothetical protein GCK72_003286 [Caenorhabditis remanei]